MANIGFNDWLKAGLAERGFEGGHVNELWYNLLGSLGFTGTFNDRVNADLKSRGYAGILDWQKAHLVWELLPPAMSAYSSIIVDDVPTGYWKVGETTGTTAFDSFGDNDGLIVGAVTMGVEGAIADDDDTAFTQTATGQYIEIDGGLWDGVGNFSVEAWIKTSNTTEIMVFWDREIEISGASRIQLIINQLANNNLSAGNVALFIANSGGGGTKIGTTTANVSDGAWHHLVAGRDGDEGFIYVDAVEKANATVPFDNAHLGTSFWIGRPGDDITTNWFDGTYDEVAFWDYDLRPNILSHYNAGIGV